MPCLISRTGYTGERGFELFCPAVKADPLARAAALGRMDALFGLVAEHLAAREDQLGRSLQE